MTVDVSVIIPTYNQNPKYLIEAIESCLCQTYPKEKIEILVVDDGSTRIEPDRAVLKFKDEGVKLRKEKHGGTAKALNAGIRNMQGNFFKWLSSDDALTEDSIEVLMSKANEKTVVYADWVYMDENSRLQNVYHEPVFANMHEAKRGLWKSYFGNADAVLIPKSAFKKVGLFDETLPFAEDYDWWLRAMFLYDYEFVHLEKLVAKYRVHQNQITTRLSTKDKEKLLNRWRMKRRVYLAMDPTLRSDAIPEPTISSLLQQMLIYNTAIISRKIFGTTQQGRAHTPERIRSVAESFIAKK
jgi:glycosyltransferase involved in cell wall biosynthesis